jgi:hypothetical protein
MTQIAVIAFQRRKGLKPDGVVGPKTAKALGWDYTAVQERPYTVRYDKPPLPPVTPPLAVVAEAIRAGMDQVKERIGDDFWEAFSNPDNDPYYQRLMGRVYKDNPSITQKQFRQRLLRIQDLVFHYKRFSDILDQLPSLSVTESRSGACTVARCIPGIHIPNAFCMRCFRLCIWDNGTLP